MDDFKTLAALFQGTADKLASEGMTTENIAYYFAKFAKQKANQEKEKARQPALKLADKLGI